MKQRFHLQPTTVLAVLCLAAMPAAADSLFTFSRGAAPYTTTGSALFRLTGPKTFTILVSNTTDPTQKSEQAITGLAFNAASILETIVLDRVTAADGLSAPTFYQCVSGTCTVDSTPNNQKTGADLSPPSYGWIVRNANPFQLAAGGGSWKPAGIVNTTTLPKGTTGGLNVKTHNDWMVGPVLFSFTTTKTITTLPITNVTFHLGTGSDTAPGTLVKTPEPGFLPELFLGLMGLALAMWRLRIA